MGIEVDKSIIFCDLATVVDIEKVKDIVIWKDEVFIALNSILKNTDYDLVIFGALDKVGTEEFPRNLYDNLENYIGTTLESQGILLEDIIISFDKFFDLKLLMSYLKRPYDKDSSYIITDKDTTVGFLRTISFTSWSDVMKSFSVNEFENRVASIVRNTKETNIELELNLDGKGRGHVESGIGFFDHMIDQLIKHSGIDLHAHIKGDIFVDEHHSVEDFAIVLGQAFLKALGDKRGIKRYGSDSLIMDDVVASVLIDFSSRPEFIFNIEFSREMVGNFPTELFYHFFKSFSNEAKCNLYVEAGKGNAHHQAEAVFKAFARAVKMAVKRVPGSNELPSTKGVL